MLCENDPRLFDDQQTRAQLEQLLGNFSYVYNSVHPIICLAICPLGILANIVHILILSQRLLRFSAVNVCLMGVAICDIFTMASYFTYIVRFEIMNRYLNYTEISYFWAMFLRFHATSSIALHTTTLYTIVAMAVIRWRTMRQTYNEMMKPHFAWKIFACVSLSVTILCVPTFLVHEVIPAGRRATEVPTDPPTSYTVDISKWALKDECKFFKANLFIIGIMLKAIPCFLLLWFTISLMILLQRNNAKRALLLFSKSGGQGARKTKHYDRTTFTLVVMLSVFLLTELPQGILAVLNGVYTNDIHSVFYMHLANVLDLLSLINCYVGFITYGFLCAKYRQTFILLLLKCMGKFSSSSVHYGQHQMRLSSTNNSMAKVNSPLLITKSPSKALNDLTVSYSPSTQITTKSSLVLHHSQSFRDGHTTTTAIAIPEKV